MKKIFTLVIAFMAALTLNAQSTIFLWQYDGSSVYGDGNNNGIFDVAADATNGTVKFVTWEKKKTSADGTSAYDASVTDNDLKPNITKVCKLGNNGAHMRISPASGNFQAGDSLFICGYKDFIVSTSTDPTSTAKINSADGGATIIASALATGSGKGACEVGYVVLPEDFVETNEIYISRANGTSAGIAAIKVVRPEQREIDHVDTTLAGVAVNGEALSDIQMATLYGALTLNLTAEYVEAPTVTFTVQTDTYYVGEETPSTKSKDIDVVAALNPDGEWQAQQTVGEQTYTITAVKPATATVTYMDGATVLGEEIVKVGESATKHGEYEVKPLAEFQGWYTDAELTSEANLSATVGADMVLYGKFVKAYAQSLNIEQLVVTNGKSYGIKDALTAAGYEYSDLDALDSLNNEKGAARNEPYLGLKIKKQGGFIACNVATGSTIRVKFGYVENDVLAIAGNDTMTLTPANKTLDVLEYTATADTYVKIQTTSGKTVVIKQIMVDEAITDVMYKITYEAAENGKVEGWTIAFPNEEVNLTVTPDSAYHVVSVTAGNEVLLPDTAGNYSFEMIAQDITVSATFAADEPVVPTLYKVTIDGLTENGAVGVQILGSSMEFEEGTELTLANIPEEGYELDEYIVYKTGEPTTLVTVTDGKFIMPAYDVTVSATFKLIPVVEMFTVTLGTYEHGTVAFIEPNEGNKYAEGAEVRLSVTPDEGYELEAISLDGIDLAIPVVDGVATFNMPAQNVTVLATFKQTGGQGFDNIDASMKATKRIINGKLFIEKNGKLYDAQGAMVK